MRHRRLPPLVALTLVAGVATACGGGSASPGAPPSTVHVAQPVGATPSKSAAMVCSHEAQVAISSALGVSPTTVSAPTWIDHVYACTYTYPDGSFTLSVQELANAGETTAVFEGNRARLGDAGPVNGLGQGAFATTDGSLVVRKDYKVLTVDVARLPARFGVPPTPSSDVAVTVGDLIMGCWSGD